MEKVIKLIEFCPINLLDQFFINIFISIDNIIEILNDDDIKKEFIDLIPHREIALIVLRERNGSPFKTEEMGRLNEIVTKLLSSNDVSKEVWQIIEGYVENFGDQDCTIFITAMIESFTKNQESENINDLLLNSICKWNIYVSGTQRGLVIDKINSLIISNNIVNITTATGFLSRVIPLEDYLPLLKNYSLVWLQINEAEDLEIFKKRMEIDVALIKTKLITPNEFANAIIPYIPFSGDQIKLHLVLDILSNIQNNLSGTVGKSLFISISNNLASFGPIIPNGLKIISPWIKMAEEPYRSQFVSQVKKEYPNHPVEILRIISDSWLGLTEAEIKEQIYNLYSVDLDQKSQELRDKTVYKGLNNVLKAHRVEFIQSIWDKMIDNGDNPNLFMRTAIKFMPLDVLLNLRENAIGIVRENGASPIAERNLRLLSNLVRNDIREIMPTVELFTNLFGRGLQDVQMALKYVVPCMVSFNIRNDHRHKLAAAMGMAAKRIKDPDVITEINNKASLLRLKTLAYRKYW